MEFVQKYGIYALGFFAQAMFGGRQLVQLIISERKGRVVSPTLFWQLSLLGSFLFLIYGIIRNDIVIIFGQALSYFIYIRNLQLKKSWEKFPWAARLLILLLPVVALVWIMTTGDKTQNILATTNLNDPILAIGAVGQLMLNFRFVYQWIYSEKQSDSVLPLGFWMISALASLMIIFYATHRSDPVLLLAQGLAIFLYVRNIAIHFKSKPKTA